MEATKGGRGGRGGEAWYAREGQQAGEPAASWRLESTAQPVARRTEPSHNVDLIINYTNPHHSESTRFNKVLLTVLTILM